MGRSGTWMVTLSGRPAMRSPGAPPTRRDVAREFWGRIAEGLSTAEASAACGVSEAVGCRLFRQGGGMPNVALEPPSGRCLSFAEREEIALARERGEVVRDITAILATVNYTSPPSSGSATTRAAGPTLTAVPRRAMSMPEIIRCQKRYLAREIFGALRAD